MSTAAALAAEFERVNRELAEYLRSLDSDQWLARAVNSPIMQYGDEDENRPIGTIVHHVASSHLRTIDNLPLMAAGEPMPRPQPGSAARHATEHAEPDQAETIALLEDSARRLADLIRGLSDEQLGSQTTTFLGATTVGEFIARAVNFHPVWHHTSIRATLEPAVEPS
jgi:hypothetical protein